MNFGGTFGGAKGAAAKKGPSNRGAFGESFDMMSQDSGDFDRSHNQDLSAALNNNSKNSGAKKGGIKKMPAHLAGGYPPIKSSISDIVDEKDK